MSTDVNRLAVITWLAGNCGGRGRTALMKFCYFLQVVRGVPLGYRFTLYSYGPFDSDVLSDLGSAEAMGCVTSTVVYFSGGYGYRIEAGEFAEKMQEIGRDFIGAYADDLRWVVDHFGSWDASDLELASTLVYADREAYRDEAELTVQKLSQRVRELKPRFSIGQIEGFAERVRSLGILQSIR